MKSWIVATLLLTAALCAQTGPASGSSTPSPAGATAAGITVVGDAPVNQGPAYSQQYCSGFITRAAISRSSFVLGSKESPHEDRFQQRSVLFLRGPGLAEGERYSVVRQISDPNHEDSSPDQRHKLASLGSLYEDVGQLTVHSIENGTAIATLDFACTAAIPGDLVVPFEERPQIVYRPPTPELGQFLGKLPRTTGQIVGARDFLALLGTGIVVYTDFGANKGAKPGDYLLITRGYSPDDLNKIDRASIGLPVGAEATAVNPAHVPPDRGNLMPNHVLGEMVVLNVTAEASAAIITSVVDELQLGDIVHLEGQEEGSEASAGGEACRNSALQRALVRAHLSHGCKGPGQAAAQ